MIRMALRDPATSRDASASRNRMKLIPTDHAPAGDVPIAFRFSVCPGKGGNDFRSPTPQSPPVGRGRSIDCPMTYSPSRREGARGWAIQFRPSLCSSTDILYAMGISSVSPPSSARSMVLLGLCACLRPAGTGCEPAPSCRHGLPHPEHRDVNAALTPSLALDSRQSMLHDTISRRSPKAPLALGGVRPVRPMPSEHAIAAPAVREALTQIAPQRLQGAQGRDRRGLGAQDPRAEP